MSSHDQKIINVWYEFKNTSYQYDILASLIIWALKIFYKRNLFSFLVGSSKSDFQENENVSVREQDNLPFWTKRSYISSMFKKSFGVIYGKFEKSGN